MLWLWSFKTLKRPFLSSCHYLISHVNYRWYIVIIACDFWTNNHLFLFNAVSDWPRVKESFDNYNNNLSPLQATCRRASVQCSSKLSYTAQLHHLSDLQIIRGQEGMDLTSLAFYLEKSLPWDPTWIYWVVYRACLFTSVLSNVAHLQKIGHFAKEAQFVWDICHIYRNSAQTYVNLKQVLPFTIITQD